MGQYSATQIYQNIRGGPGPTSLLDAGQAGTSQADTQRELQDEINRLNTKMGNAWSGNASDAAKTGATPLTQAASDAADALTTHQTNVNSQVESFNYTYQNVNNVPTQGPQNNIMNEFETAVGIQTPLDNQMSQYNAQSQQNVALYQNYSNSSTQTADGVPKVYGAIPTENANITVIPPSSSGPGGPGYTGSTGPSGSGYSPSYRSSTPPYSGPTGPSTEPNFTPGPVETGNPVPPPYSTTPSGNNPNFNIPIGDGPGGPNGLGPNTYGNLPPDEYNNPNFNLGPNGGTDPFGTGGAGPEGELPGGGGGGGFGGAGGADSLRTGSGLGSGSGGGPGGGSESGAGARGGVGGMNPAEEAAMRGGMPGAAGANGAGGPMGGGRGGRKEEDKEHKTASYLQENDPDALFGSDALTAPPVIGGE